MVLILVVDSYENNITSNTTDDINNEEKYYIPNIIPYKNTFYFFIII